MANHLVMRVLVAPSGPSNGILTSHLANFANKCGQWEHYCQFFDWRLDESTIHVEGFSSLIDGMADKHSQPYLSPDVYTSNRCVLEKPVAYCLAFIALVNCQSSEDRSGDWIGHVSSDASGNGCMRYRSGGQTVVPHHGQAVASRFADYKGAGASRFLATASPFQ